MRKIILKSELSPGDVCTMTAAIESLHATYPGKYLTAVRTPCDEIFLHNPHLASIDESAGQLIRLEYSDLIQNCDDLPNHFLRGYCYDLGKQLEIPLELTVNRPCLYLSTSEKRTNALRAIVPEAPAHYWLVSAGVKRDFTAKQWPVEHYQQVVDHFKGRIVFVQIGSGDHDHPRLRDAVDLVGKTNVRQLICLAYHAAGGLGPITFIQHLCAAFEKPYVALLGGREPVQWTQYPIQATMHTIGRLNCCRTRSCWKSRVIPLHDGEEQDDSLCERPILDLTRPVGACMQMIRAADVIRAIEGYYEGGGLTLC